MNRQKINIRPTEREKTDEIRRQMMRVLYPNGETLNWYTYLLMPSLHTMHNKRH